MKRGGVDGGMYDLFSTGDLTVDGTLDFKDNSLEYVDVVESILSAILDCPWNCVGSKLVDSCIYDESG